MIVQELNYDGFRNLKTGTIQPDPGVNIVYGSNAQGKTNLLEAIWFFTGGRSFRGTRDRETVAIGRDKGTLKMKFLAAEREQEAKINIEKRRSVLLNGIPQSSAAALAGRFCAVVFSPTHLSMIKDGPEGRRRFLDAAYCQIRPGYIRILSEYQRTLAQRNALIKLMRTTGRSTDELAVWNERLAKSGAQVITARTAYIRKLAVAAENIYDGFSGGKEPLKIHYHSLVGDETTAAHEIGPRLYALLESSTAADLSAGFSTVGPHRDDLAIDICDLSARIYASQGQQRSAVLSLKLAEASVLKEVTGEHPVALLDDVMSELDLSRQDYILNHIGGWQVFITCCDPSAVIRLTDGKSFYVENGCVT